MHDREADFDGAGTAELAALLARYRKILVLTGAGISTASGIPAYRDEHGVRRGRTPIHGPDFRAKEAVRRRYWARSMLGWPTLARAVPNAAHRALAELERGGRIAALLTQNVDGLHQRAGSAGVTELHGNIHRVLCLACGAGFARETVQHWLEQANPDLAGRVGAPLPDGDAEFEPERLAPFRIPACHHCGGMLQPDVVFFGDNLPGERSAAAARAVAEAEALLVVGSSLAVFSGFRLCRQAVAEGKPVAAINLGTTRADPLLALKLSAPSEIALPALARRLGAA